MTRDLSLFVFWLLLCVISDQIYRSMRPPRFFRDTHTQQCFFLNRAASGVTITHQGSMFHPHPKPWKVSVNGQGFPDQSNRHHICSTNQGFACRSSLPLPFVSLAISVSLRTLVYSVLRCTLPTLSCGYPPDIMRAHSRVLNVPSGRKHKTGAYATRYG